MIRFQQKNPLQSAEIDQLASRIVAGTTNLEWHSESLMVQCEGATHIALTGSALEFQWGESGDELPRTRSARVAIDLSAMEARLTTDRFGTWPLCYADDYTQGVRFASRADAVPCDSSPEIDPQSIFDYLYFHFVPTPNTIFQQIRKVPPATVLTLHRDHPPTLTNWWPSSFNPAPTSGVQFDALKTRFLDIVSRSVDHDAKGRFAAFLSGGTDSSTVVGMLCRKYGPVRSFSMGFEAEGYDEMSYARMAAKHFGADHHEHYVTADELTTHIRSVATHYDQPFGNSSALPAFILALIARSEGFDHLLAGDGGDELFGGNVRYAKQKVFGYYEMLPATLRSGVIEPLLNSPAGRLPVARKAASYVRQARTPLPDRNAGHNLILNLGPNDILEPAFLANIQPSHPLTLQRDVWHSANTSDDLNRALAFDWRFTLADNDLPKVIGTTELAGMTVAFPLLSDELVDFSLTLPIDYKLRRFKLRWFFKEALRGFLPDAILSKKKHGFGLPFGVWSLKHAGLRQLADDSLRSFGRRGVIKPEFLHKLQTELHPAYPNYYGEMVWIVMMLELWLQDKKPAWSLA